MFNRRKPESEPMPTAESKPAGVSPLSEIRPAMPDSGVGVPPFRPAMPKEAPMGRTPFPAPPSSNPPPGPGTPPSPRPGMGMNQPAQMGSNMGNPNMGGSSMGAPNRAATQSERRMLVVGRGISVQGTVTDAERLVVEGTVEATMIHATELSIALGGVFRGEVEVEDAEIAGTIDGTLIARGSMTVRATGKVLGTARCRRLQVEDGGQITGRIEMITGEAQRETSSSSSTSSIPTPPATSAA